MIKTIITQKTNKIYLVFVPSSISGIVITCHQNQPNIETIGSVQAKQIKI